MSLNTEIPTAPNTQHDREKPLPRSIQRKFRSLLLLAVSGGALITTPQIAQADITPNPAPNYLASGALTTPQVVNDDNANVTTDGPFSVTTGDGDALTITGNGAIVYNDANNSGLVATGNFGALVVHSTGNDGIYGEDGTTLGNVTITTNGDLTGGSVGMDVTNSGSNRTNITSTGTVTATDSSGIGVKVTHNPSAYHMNVKVADVTGGQTGISIQKNGIGDTDLIATGTVIGTSGTGVFVTDNSSAGNTRVTVAGVTGGTDGIVVQNYGAGDATITATGTVTGTTGTGIAVNYNHPVGHDLTVKAAAVTGFHTGISALHKGYGDTSITATGTVAATGDSSTGIDVTNEENTVDLTVDVASVSGGEFGIKATNDGTGNTSVTAKGTVTGTTDTGIKATHDADGSLTVNAAAVTGGQYGINAINNGNGDTSVTATGTVTGETGDGIYAYNDYTAKDLILNVVDVSGELNGINATNYGTGTITITSTGTVTGNTEDGIRVLNDAQSQGLTVNAHNVTGGIDGINATHFGSGDVIIKTTGDVIGETSDGIAASNSSPSRNISVEAVNVTGSQYGIYTSSYGTGDTTIEATGTVTATNGTGVMASAYDESKNLTVTVHDVSGSDSGISTFNSGTGDTVITSTGSVTGTDFFGITAYNDATANDLAVDAVNVNGFYYGIQATNEGRGNTTVTTTGTVTAEVYYGVLATNDESAGDLTVDVHNVTGNLSGINATNNGQGNTVVKSTGTVEGAFDDGIVVTNEGNTVDLTVDVHNVTGDLSGINATNNGSGATSITSTGTVTGTSEYGISVTNGEDTNDLTVEANNVTGGLNGILAVNKGSGETSITATGTVIATSTGTELEDGVGIYVENTDKGSDITVEANNVTGTQTGIQVINFGESNTSVTATGTVEGTGVGGINVSNSANSVELTVHAATVIGSKGGIAASNAGSGNTSVTATGAVTATDGTGIVVSNGSTSSGSLTVHAAAVTGSEYGIGVSNNGTGNTSVTATGTVEGTNESGIQVETGTEGTGLTVNAATVTGSNTGISATNNGTGNTSVTATGTVTATGDESIGIEVTNGENTTDLTVNAHNVTGGNVGIHAENNGDGITSVTSTGTVEGTESFGIYAFNTQDGNGVAVSAHNATGGQTGISASNNGSGDVSVTATGSVSGGSLYGIGANNGENGNDVTVNAHNASGGQVGINVEQAGSGDTSVTATGTVEGTTWYGIRVETQENAGDVTVNAHNATGGVMGIYAINGGSGETSVTSTGTVTATGDESIGIKATNSGKGVGLTVNAHNVTGDYTGIHATNNGGGNTSVTATGTVEATSLGNFNASEGVGIYAVNSEKAIDLTVEGHNVNGAAIGIQAINNGTGNTSVSSTGTIAGTSSKGIEIFNASDTHDLTVNAHNVTGGQYGIDAGNYGTGESSVTATGTVEGTGKAGIKVVNAADTQNLTVEANNVTGGELGIHVQNYGTGDTSVTSTGTVVGTRDAGIIAVNDDTAKDLTVNANNVTGKQNGILAENEGTGNTSVAATGTVTATAEESTGISVENGATAIDLTVEANNVTGGEDGIFASNSGTGNTSVTATGTVLGTNQYGIVVGNGENAKDLTVEANNVTGGELGITATNNGTGTTSVTATGTVVGTAGTGINVGNGENANGLTVNAHNVIGGNLGMRIDNGGTGDTSVSSTGTIEGTDGIGIHALTGSNTQNLTVDVNNVTSQNMGILIGHTGSGNTSVTATGTVVGTNWVGLDVVNSSTTQDLTVEANNVSGGQMGINISNNGKGNTSVTAIGTVTGTAGDSVGIVARTGVNANDLTVEANNVSGGAKGIDINNSGKGNTSVTSIGTVAATAEESTGISVENGTAAIDLTVDANNVTGTRTGIAAFNYGKGDTTVKSIGTVSGTADESAGINVMNDTTANNLTVEANNVTGGQMGIYSLNQGTGDTSVTSTGTVAGNAGDGISVSNYSTAHDLTVNVNNVTGGRYGINAFNDGNGDTNVTATGTVTATGAVVWANSYAVSVVSYANTQNMTIAVHDVTGGEAGIYAAHYGSGATSITSTGTAVGTEMYGIYIYNAGPEDTIVNANNASGGLVGIRTDKSDIEGTGTTAITVSGIVEGGEAGIETDSSGGHAITITNNGTVRNSSQSTSALAITNEIGATTINNNQLLLGTVALGESGNTLNNKGTWDVAGGTSDLGSGANILNNQVGGSILAVGSEGPVSTTFNGVGTFTHNGSLVLQNQRAGGTTAYAGDVATFTNGGSAAFLSNGGVVYLDTDFENETSDVLVVDNVSRQGNATVLVINATSAITGKALAGDGIELVNVQGTSGNDAFVLAEPIASAGLFNYGLGQGTQDSQSWFLQSNLRPVASAAGAFSVLGSRTALSTLPGMQDRQREDNPDEQLFGQRSGARLVSRDLTLPDARPQATKGVWGRVIGESSKFQSENGSGYDTKLWGAQAGLDFYATSNQKGDRQYAGVYIGQASASGDALGGSGVVGSLNVDATTVGAYYTFSSSRGWYVDVTAQYSKLSDMKLAAGGETVRPDGSSYAVSLEAGKVLNQQSKLRTELQAQVIYQKTDVDDITLSDNTRLTLGGLNTTTGRVGVRLSKNPQYAGKFQPWLRANLWHTLNEEATVSSMGVTSGTAIGGTSGEVQVGFALTPSQSSSWSAYAAAGYTFDLSGAQYSGWKGSLGLRKGW